MFTSLPQNLLDDAGTLREDFETTVGWVVGSGSLANDTTHYKVGTQALKLTSPVGGTGQITKVVNWDLSGSEEIRIWMYVYDTTKVDDCHIALANAGYTKWFTSSLDYKNLEGWNLIALDRTEFAVANGMTWDTAIGNVRLWADAMPGETAIVSFDGLYSDIVAVPALVVSFDDAMASVYTVAFDYMRDHNIPGTVYATTDYVDIANRMTWAQLAEVNGAGWMVGNHTKSHADLSTLTQAQVAAQWNDARTVLESHGFTENGVSHGAYPYGAFTDTVLAGTADASMLTARTTAGIGSHSILPFDEAYKLVRGENFGVPLSRSNAKIWLDELVDKKELGIAVFHDIIETPTLSSQWGIEDFQAFIRHVVERDVPCITTDQAYLLQSAEQPGSVPNWGRRAATWLHLAGVHEED